MICFDIGGSRVRAGRWDGATISPLGEAPTPADDYFALCSTLAQFVVLGGPGPVAMSLAGGVDPASGRLRSANIACLNGRVVADDIAVALGRKVHVTNDADCFTLAEATWGVGRGQDVVLGIILGTGVGGGLAVANRLVRGAGGYTGEWGHGPVVPDRALGRDLNLPVCGCGQRGCVETIGGARGLERLHLALAGERLRSEDIVARWRAGPCGASRSVELWLQLLSGPLALAVNLTGAGVVAVGGGLSGAVDLIAALDHAVRQKILRPSAEPVLRCGALGEMSGLIGAALSALADTR